MKQPCNCYYGVDCTKTTVCANEAVVEELEDRIEELEAILEDLLGDAGFYHSAIELWMIDGEEFKKRIIKALGGDDG